MSSRPTMEMGFMDDLDVRIGAPANDDCAEQHRQECGEPVASCRGHIMISTLLLVLIALWLLGMGTAYTMGGLIHVLLVIAVIVVLVRVIQGRNPFAG